MYGGFYEPCIVSVQLNRNDQLRSYLQKSFRIVTYGSTMLTFAITTGDKVIATPTIHLIIIAIIAITDEFARKISL